MRPNRILEKACYAVLNFKPGLLIKVKAINGAPRPMSRHRSFSPNLVYESTNTKISKHLGWAKRATNKAKLATQELCLGLCSWELPTTTL